MTDNMPSPERGILGRINKKAASLVLAGSALVASVGGYAVTHQGQPQPVGTETPSAAAASPTPKETPTPTVTVTKSAEPTKSPEVAKVPCLVVEQKYCDQAERVMVPTNGVYVEYIGLNDLPQNTPIFARKDGFLDKTRDGAGFTAVVRDNIGGTTYKGDLRFDDLLSKDVKAGDIIGYIDNKNTSGYKLLTTDTKRTPNGPVVDEDSLKEQFPAAFQKPIKILTGEAQNPVFISNSSTPPSQKP